jgi:hypothetical protein
MGTHYGLTRRTNPRQVIRRDTTRNVSVDQLSNEWNTWLRPENPDTAVLTVGRHAKLVNEAADRSGFRSRRFDECRNGG